MASPGRRVRRNASPRGGRARKRSGGCGRLVRRRTPSRPRRHDRGAVTTVRSAGARVRAAPASTHIGSSGCSLGIPDVHEVHPSGTPDRRPDAHEPRHGRQAEGWRRAATALDVSEQQPASRHLRVVLQHDDTTTRFTSRRAAWSDASGSKVLVEPPSTGDGLIGGPRASERRRRAGGRARPANGAAARGPGTGERGRHHRWTARARRGRRSTPDRVPGSVRHGRRGTCGGSTPRKCAGRCRATMWCDGPVERDPGRHDDAASRGRRQRATAGPATPTTHDNASQPSAERTWRSTAPAGGDCAESRS